MKKKIIHYAVKKPTAWDIDNIDFACGEIYGKFTHYKPDVICKRCRYTKIFSRLK